MEIKLNFSPGTFIVTFSRTHKHTHTLSVFLPKPSRGVGQHHQCSTQFPPNHLLLVCYHEKMFAPTPTTKTTTQNPALRYYITMRTKRDWKDVEKDDMSNPGRPWITFTCVMLYQLNRVEHNVCRSMWIMLGAISHARHDPLCLVNVCVSVLVCKKKTRNRDTWI